MAAHDGLSLVHVAAALHTSMLEKLHAEMLKGRIPCCSVEATQHRTLTLPHHGDTLKALNSSIMLCRRRRRCRSCMLRCGRLTPTRTA